MNFYVRSVMLFLASAIWGMFAGMLARIVCGPMLAPALESDAPLLRMLLIFSMPLILLWGVTWLGIVLGADSNIMKKGKFPSDYLHLNVLFIQTYNWLGIMPNLDVPIRSRYSCVESFVCVIGYLGSILASCLMWL